MPSFKVNPETNEIGYWTGSELIVLPKSMSYDVKGAQNLIEELSKAKEPPKFENFAPDQQQAVEKLYAATRPKPTPVPEASTGFFDRLLASAKQARASMTPRELMTGSKSFEDEKIRQQGMSKGEIAKDMILELLGGIPAMAGGIGVGALLPKAVSRIGSMVQRVLTGAGAAGGELIGQATGVLPEDLLRVAAAGIGGAVGGRVHHGPVTPPEKIATKIASAGPARTAEVTEKAMFKQKLGESLSRPDVDSQKIINPLEDIIIKERGSRPIPRTPGRATPETGGRESIINELSDIAANLGNVITIFDKQVPGVPLPKGATPKPTGAPGLGSPARTQIPGPGKLASEADIPSLGKKQQETSAFGTPTTNAPKSPAPGGIQITGMQQTDSAQTVVTEVQRLTKLRERARAIGANDLAQDIDKGLKQIRTTIGYEEAAPHWAQGKGFEESKILIRGKSATARIMNSLEGRRASTFTPDQKQALISSAAKSEQIDKVLSWMMQNPTGQSLLRAGVTPKGTILPSVLHIGAQMMAHGGAEMAFEALTE